ncbi:glycosyltransferase [Rhodococcus sp. IEGM1300]
MIRELFSKRPQPYYIYAPNFRRSSAGIRVLHMLCDALNRSGHEAYVVAQVLNPDLITPYLSAEVMALHKSQGLEPVVVYPEIIDGNPLGAGVVVRYLLNQPGYLGGKGVYAEDDLLFAYSRGLLQPGMAEENVLHLPPIDLSIFCPPVNPAKRVSGRVCYYQGREGRAKIDPELLPADATEITAEFPDSWEGLAGLFHQCEYFYLAERSGLAAEAALCGCISIVLPGQYAPGQLSEFENKNYGTAWGNTPEAIERARETLPLLRQVQLQHQARFWSALDYFIEVTQEAATNHKARSANRVVSQWMGTRVCSETQRRLMVEHQAANVVPLVGVLVFNNHQSDEPLSRTLASFERLGWFAGNLRIIVLGARPTFAAADGSLRDVIYMDSKDVACVNRLLGDSDFDWFVMAEAGVEFSPAGLPVSAASLKDAGEGVQALFADETIRMADGTLDIVLRPDMNLDLLLSLPASLSPHWFYRRAALLELGGFAPGYGQAFELEFQLRLICEVGVACVAHVCEPLLISEARPLQDCADERAVIEGHLLARGYNQAQVLPLEHLGGGYRLDYGHARQPMVSILILLEGRLSEFRRCVESILESTEYPYYEVLLLDHGIEDAEVLDWLAMVEQVGGDRLCVERFAPEQSVASLSNDAAAMARGEFLLWLGAKAGILGKGWLPKLLNHALRPEVGAVGGKLLSAQGKIHHAGLLLGIGGSVGRAFHELSHESVGYMQRLQVDQNYSALSSECLMVRRSLFQEAGGFDESPLLKRWVDVDLCLKLQQAGYLNVWTPHVQLLIGACEITRASVEEEDALYARWLPMLARDPAYNTGLSLRAEATFRLDDHNLAWHPFQGSGSLPSVLAHPDHIGDSGHYRIVQPFDALKEQGLISGALLSGMMTVPELDRYDPHVIVMQCQLSEEHLQAMRRMSTFSQAFKIFELNEYLPELPLDSVRRLELPEGIVGALKRGLLHVDRFVVATPALAEAFAGWHEDIRVIPSLLPGCWWSGKQGRRQAGTKPRVGWAGSVEHARDLALIARAVVATAAEVEWVFVGYCPDNLRPYVHELHSNVPADCYPVLLAGLNLDFAVAPLGDTLFNRCKSNTVLLEYGVCGVPVVCSDIEPYRCGLPVTLVNGGVDEWLKAIRAHLNDLDQAAVMGNALQSAVRRDWMLEGEKLLGWRDIWLPA